MIAPAPELPPEPRAPVLHPEPPPPPEGWKRARLPPVVAVVAVLAGIVIGVGSNLLLAIPVMFEIAARGITDPQAVEETVRSTLMTLPYVAASVTLLGVGLALVPLFAAWLSKTSLREGMGFRAAHPATFVLGPIGILTLGPLSDLMVRGMTELFPDASFGALESIEALTKAYSFWALVPFIALMPGFTEEIFFRGLVQRSLGNTGTKAIVISAITFSLFHLDPHHVAGVLPLGFYLAWLGARTGSLWVPIVAHAVNNAVALLASQAQVDAVDPNETLPWFATPIGLALCALCIWGLVYVTRDRDRHSGPVSLPNASERILPPARS